MKRKEIVLIGPCNSGKSTIAFELSKQLNINWFQLDIMRWYCFYKNGYDLKAGMQLYNSGKMLELHRMWKPLELITVEQILNEFKEGVFDFGGTYTLFENKEDFLRIRKTLSDFSNVILIMPWEDKEKTLAVLAERRKKLLAGNKQEDVKRFTDLIEQDRKMLYNEENYLLAKHVFYFEDKTKEELAAEIISCCC